MNVYKLTLSQRNQLVGHTYDGVQLFNTDAIDADGNCFVSQEEVNGCDKPEFQWLKSCELIEHNPVVVNLHF